MSIAWRGPRMENMILPPSIRTEFSFDEPVKEGEPRTIGDSLGRDPRAMLHRRIQAEQELPIVTRALSKLSPKDRALIHLRYGFCGETWGTRELAQMLGITKQAVALRERRILRKLRGFLQHRKGDIAA